MGNRMKEGDRTEKIIRSLLKLPENRRCINCNSLVDFLFPLLVKLISDDSGATLVLKNFQEDLSMGKGPQYVCTTFCTFVCTNCSGIHREFTHRVKSISMAKFNAEEVNALQAGGNEKAKQIYFKEWNLQRHSFPDSCNIPRLRDFIKHVYVDRKYTGEKSSENLHQLRLDDKDESYKSQTINALRLGSKSLHYDETHEQCYGERSSPDLRSDERTFKFYYDERRSPRYAYHSRHASHSRSAIKFEVVDDRFRDNEFRTRRLPSLESKLRKLSADVQNTLDGTQSSVAHPVGEVIGEKVPTPQAAGSSADGSVEGNPAGQTQNNPESFTDLNTKSQAPDAVADSERQPISQSNESNWIPFETSKSEMDPQTPNADTLQSSNIETNTRPTNHNTTEFLLFELSGPLSATTRGASEVPRGDNDLSTAKVENVSAGRDFPPIKVGQTTASPNNTVALPVTSNALALPSNDMHPHPFNEAPTQPELLCMDSSVKVSHRQQITTMHIPPPSSVVCSSMTQSTSPLVRAVASNNQPPVAPYTHNSLSTFTNLSSQTTSKSAQDMRSDVASEPAPVKAKSSGRKELPEDHFTTSYLSGPAPLAGWQNVQPHGMGYGMQHYRNTPLSTFPIAAKSTNPFEVTEESTHIHASRFPTMASLQGVLPAGSSGAGILHASNLGSAGLMVPQSPSYGSLMAPQSPFPGVIPTGAYFEQVNNNMQHSRPQRVGSFNGDRTSFGPLNLMQQSAEEYMTPSTRNSFYKTGGNPFG